MKTLPEEVDLVFLWVDGDDPVWQEKKSRYSPGKASDERSELNFKGRYSNNDELKYALRSATRHAPWIREIFIVTDNQRPEWLKTDVPGITIVDHTEIMPAEALPCFNSTVIEHYLHKIPGLAEHFLYANDDMFFNADLSPAFFFGPDGHPIVRMKRKFFGKWHNRIKRFVGKKLGQYAHTLARAAEIAENKLGAQYPGVPHHNIDSYRKSDFRDAAEVVFAEEIKRTISNRTRAFNDLQRMVFSLYALHIGRAHLKYVSRGESSRILLYRHNFLDYLESHQPKLFCLNDNQRIKDHHRAQIASLLEAYFPGKSVFEK